MTTMMSNATGIAGDAPARQAIERVIAEAQVVDGAGHEPVLSREANLCRIATVLEPEEAGRRLAAMVLTCYTPDERAEFDLQAIVLRAAFALADEARGTLFQRAVDLVVAEKGEPPVPWPAAMIVEAEEEPIAAQASGRRDQRRGQEAPTARRTPTRRGDHGELLPWQRQLAAARERFPDRVPTPLDGGDASAALATPISLTATPPSTPALPAPRDVIDVDRAGDGEAAPESRAGAPSPPSLDALRERRERILAADRARRKVAAAGLAEHAALVEEPLRRGRTGGPPRRAHRLGDRGPGRVH